MSTNEVDQDLTDAVQAISNGTRMAALGVVMAARQRADRRHAQLGAEMARQQVAPDPTLQRRPSPSVDAAAER